MAAVRGPRAPGTPLPHNPSLTQTQTLHYAGSEPELNPISNMTVFQPLLHCVDIGLCRLRKQIPEDLGLNHGSACVVIEEKVTQKWAKR